MSGQNIFDLSKIGIARPYIFLFQTVGISTIFRFNINIKDMLPSLFNKKLHRIQF